MDAEIKRIQKITSKGQITLPALWRKQFKTNQILIKAKNKYFDKDGELIKLKNNYDFLSSTFFFNSFNLFNASIGVIESLEISPFYLEEKKHPHSLEYTVFDAIRDNKGKGVKAADLLDIL